MQFSEKRGGNVGKADWNHTQPRKPDMRRKGKKRERKTGNSEQRILTINFPSNRCNRPSNPEINFPSPSRLVERRGSGGREREREKEKERERERERERANA